MIGIISIICSILLILVATEMLKSQKPQKPTKIDIIILISLLILLAVFYSVSKIYNISYKYNNIYINAIGILGCLALSIHYKAIKDLNKGAVKAWADSNKPKEDAQLVTIGLYSKVRNPIYLAIFLYGILFVLLAPYLIGFAVYACGVPFYRIEISKEEKYLEEKYGQVYIDYKVKVKYKMIPFIY